MTDQIAAFDAKRRMQNAGVRQLTASKATKNSSKAAEAEVLKEKNRKRHELEVVAHQIDAIERNMHAEAAQIGQNGSLIQRETELQEELEQLMFNHGQAAKLAATHRSDRNTLKSQFGEQDTYVNNFRRHVPNPFKSAVKQAFGYKTPPV